MILDIGVLPSSERFYYNADTFTEKNLFYVPHAGVYECDNKYEVKRNYLNTCHIIVVDKGNLGVEYRGQRLIAKPGSIVILDCREPHRYYSMSDHLNIKWFHYAGNCNFAYTQMLLETKGFIIPNISFSVKQCCEKIITSMREKNTSPHVISVFIHELLSLLSISGEGKEKGNLEKLLDKTIEYMEENYGNIHISIDYLAELISISPSYYMSSFKKVHGITAYKYLQNLRLIKSKELLSTTRDSIEEIGLKCGFYSASHFIMTFKKDKGITPLQYRKLWE